jgi:hypothetical protein
MDLLAVPARSVSKFYMDSSFLRVTEINAITWTNERLSVLCRTLHGNRMTRQKRRKKMLRSAIISTEDYRKFVVLAPV